MSEPQSIATKAVTAISTPSHLAEVRQESLRLTNSPLTTDLLEHTKREWLGKDGKLKSLFKTLGSYPQEERIEVAKSLNEIKETVEQYLLKEEVRIASQKVQASIKHEFFDMTLPGLTAGVGAVHPITVCEKRLLEIARQYGFEHAIGPEIETDFFCFDALNVPQHHPARDLQDTFYTDNGYVLRTHLTAVSARSAAAANGGQIKNGGTVKSVALGRAYRNEAEDASHTAMFHQFDLVWIDKGLTLAHLMGLINNILKEVYGKRRKIRFVRKFYPYTEPSVGPQIDCSSCKGSGCASCGGSGWITVAGSGVLHRNVMKLFNFDTDKVTGLAFGMGTSRLAAQMFGFSDIRVPYENCVR